MPIHDWTRVPAGIFHDFHVEWITSVKHVLNAGVLPPEFYALAEQITGRAHPDVLALRTDDAPNGPVEHHNGTPVDSSSLGGIALAAAMPRVRFTAAAEPEVYARKTRTVTIRHTSGDRVVAVVEILSPGNKSSRHALKAVVDKAIELLDAGIHLLILDVFPPGPRDPQGIHAVIWEEYVGEEFRLPSEAPLTLVSYSAGLLKQAFIEPVAVGSILPDMPLFLEPDRYIQVPLERAYEAAFAAVPRRWQGELVGP